MVLRLDLISQLVLPRVEELFEARRMPKGEAVMATIDGTATIITSEISSDLRKVRIEQSELIRDDYAIPAGYEIKVKDEEEVAEGACIGNQW